MVSDRKFVKDYLLDDPNIKKKDVIDILIGIIDKGFSNPRTIYSKLAVKMRLGKMSDLIRGK